MPSADSKQCTFIVAVLALTLPARCVVVVVGGSIAMLLPPGLCFLPSLAELPLSNCLFCLVLEELAVQPLLARKQCTDPGVNVISISSASPDPSADSASPISPSPLPSSPKKDENLDLIRARLRSRRAARLASRASASAWSAPSSELTSSRDPPAELSGSEAERG